MSNNNIVWIATFYVVSGAIGTLLAAPAIASCWNNGFSVSTGTIAIVLLFSGLMAGSFGAKLGWKNRYFRKHF